MIALIVRVSAMLIALGTVCVGVIRARPFDDHAVQALLISDDCTDSASRACFMGIYIGVTSRDDATAILRDHPWVIDVYETQSLISWTWSGAQPAMIDSAQNGLIGFSNRDNNLVGRMRILTHLSTGDLWLSLGTPESNLLIRPFGRTSAFQIAAYDDEAIQVIGALGCPVRPQAFWTSAISIGRGEVWTTEAINSTPFAIYQFPDWWRNLRTCRPLIAR